MTHREAIDLGMAIAEKHTAACLELRNFKPEATADEMLRGCQVWLAAEIMKVLRPQITDAK